MLVLACLVVCQMVALRYFIGASTVWQTEFVTFCVVGATLIGSPYVLLQQGHVNVDLLLQRIPVRIRYWFALVISIIACLVCLILAWSGSRYFLEAWHEGWVTESIWGPPLWIPLLSLPVGLGVLTLQYVAESMQLLGQALSVRKSPPLEGNLQ